MSKKTYILENEKLMEEWDWDKNNNLGLFPDQLTISLKVKVWWKCKHNHCWDATIASRISGTNCRYCTGQAVTLERSLAVRFPDIAKEWDYEKNHPRTPKDVMSGSSSRRYFWICPICKQSYPKKISNRTAPSKRNAESDKCPVCLGRYIIPEYNSLKAKYPLIVSEEWDYEKNTVDPATIPPHQNKPKYWWKCDKGHSYDASVNNKINQNGGNCPYCSGQKVSDVNRLSIINPDLAKQWHPTKNNITPSNVSFGCNIEVWWLCPICLHEWKAKINNRHNGRGCPNCSKGQHTSFPEQVIYYYIKQLFPDAINQYKISNVEVDIFIPQFNIGIEYDGGYYHKTLDKYQKDLQKNIFLHNNNIQLIRIREEDCYPMEDKNCIIISYIYAADYLNLEATIQNLIYLLEQLSHTKLSVNIDIKGVRNYIVTQAHYIKHEYSFAAYQIKHNDNIKAVWDYELNYPITPEMVKPKSSMYVYWICKNNPNHKWKAPVGSISAGYGCSRCANRHQYSTEEWCNKAKEIHGDIYDYSLVNYVNSDTDVIIKCTIHGEFKQNPSRHLSGNGCQWCAGQGGFHILNTLAIARPDLAAEWDCEHQENHGLTPMEVLITDNTNEYWWKCNNGMPHSYKAKISFRNSRNSECAVCHGKQISYDTSLEYLRPDLLVEWHESNKIKPSEVSLGSEIRVNWKCENPDHPYYEAPIISRVKSKYGCRYCSGDKKDHKTYESEIKKKFHHIILLDKYKKSSEKIRSKCAICGAERNITAGNLLQGNIGCLKCRI